MRKRKYEPHHCDTARRLTLAAYSAARNVQTVHHRPQKNAYTQQLHHTCQNCVYQSPPALDVISCVQQHMAICSCQGRQRQHTDLAVSPSPDLVCGISYLRLCVYHRHLDRFKASWRQYFFARPTRHDSARSWLLRLLELRLTNFPTYLLTYLRPKLSSVSPITAAVTASAEDCAFLHQQKVAIISGANSTPQNKW